MVIIILIFHAGMSYAQIISVIKLFSALFVFIHSFRLFHCFKSSNYARHPSPGVYHFTPAYSLSYPGCSSVPFGISTLVETLKLITPSKNGGAMLDVVWVDSGTRLNSGVPRFRYFPDLG